MSLERTYTVDAIGLENATGCVVLTLTDAWEWLDERSHLLALQAKLNAYFEFIETGQIWTSYPLAQGRRLVIDVVIKWPLPESGVTLLQVASEVAKQLDVTVRHRLYKEGGGGAKTG